MIKKCESLQVADTVLSALAIIHGEQRENYINVECWANCREQGYHITNLDTDKAVNVGQCRRSDEIIVGFGKSGDFDNQTNQWSEEVYNTKKYFKYDEAYNAAEFIHDWLIKKK